MDADLHLPGMQGPRRFHAGEERHHSVPESCPLT